MRKTLGIGVVLLALALGAALLKPAKPESRVTPSAASQGRPLRLDRLPVEAKPIPLPSASAGRAKPATPAAPLQALPSREISAPALGSPSRTSTSANLEIGRDEVLKERGGVFGYNSRFYGATFDAGAVEIATGLILKDIGRPRLSYALEEVRAGGKVICSGGTVVAQADPETRTLSFARGSVEERYILSKESLEQTFVIRELPSGRGEISVTGRVGTNLTPPRDGTSGGSLSFLYREHELLSVSKAVAIDASGRRLPLELAYSDGRMSMTVPAEWVAAAALPILVDPVIGGPIVVDNKLTNFVDTVNGQFVRICDAAYSGASGQWLAIWAEPFGASAFNHDLFGQRVDASGASVGSPLPIGTSTGGDYESTIAASSAGNFLVAWRHDPADDASDADQVILGRIVNANGTFAGGAFTLDDLPGQDYGPSLAFGGGQWLCAFTNIPSAGNTDIRGRLVSEAGVPGPAVELDLEADLAARPSLDFASTSFVVAWEKGPAGGPYSAVARAVDVAGTLTTPITEIDGGANDATFVDVSAGGGKVLIAWQERVGPSNMNVVGRIAEPTLAFATAPITLNAGLTDQVTPRAAYSDTNSEWLVVYSDPITGGQDVYANRVSITGSAFPAEKVTTGGQADRRPELAWNSASNEMLIVYLFKTSDPYQVRARRFSMDYAAPAIPGTPVGAPNPNPTGTHTVSWAPSTDGGGSGLAGYDLQRSSDGGTSYAIIASPTGTSFTEPGLPLGSYLYRVRARDNAGNASAYSSPSDPVVVGGSAPLAPSNLAGSPQTPNSIQWTWVDASSDETGFRLKDENGATRVDSIPADATSVLETGLASNTGYSRRAFAYNSSGESAGSILAAVSTLLATPTQADFAVAATRWDQIQISVLPPPNSSELQTGVRIERSLDGAAWAIVQDFAPVYSALDSGRFQNTTHFYRITYQNRAGIPTASSPANTVSTPGMPAPVISSPADGTLLSTQTPTVSGSSAIAGLTITLFVEGLPRGSTTSGTDGSWSLPPSSPILDGQRSFTARASDALGNASAHSAAVLVTIDSNSPLITSATPANGSTTGSLRPTISAAWTDAVSGVAPATAQILLDGANITSQCTVTPTGFTHVPAVDLSQGGHTVAAQVADTAGNLRFLQWTFTVLPPDTTGPLLTLSPGQGEKVVDNTPSFTATYSDAGAGIDLSQFRAFIDNVDLTASFSAGASQATFTTAAPLADGLHLFRASIKDLAGNLTELTNLFRVVSALAEVGTGGGSLAVTDPTRATLGARIDVPSGALSQPVTLWMEHVAAASPLPPGFIRVGPVVDFMPEMSFLQPVTVSLPYDEGAAAALGVPEANLKLLRFDLASNQWVLLPVSAVQAAANLLQASLNSFAGVQIVAVAETSAQAYFVVEGPTGSIQAGTPVSITIRAFHPNGAVFDTFAGNVQVALTGGRGPAGNAVFPESIPATFTATDQGVLTPTDALTFALFGIQTVKVTADANPAMVGQTQVGVTPGPPTEFVKVAGDGQDALAGTVLAQALVTRVRDAYGNPIPGAQVSYLITSGGANFEDRPDNFVPSTPLPNPSTVTANPLGYAISPYLRLPGSSTTTLVSATLLGSTLPAQDFLLFSSANQLNPPVITSPSSGSVVNTPTPVIRGTIAIIDPEFPGAVPGYYVYLVVDGMPAGQAIIQTDLSWNILCNSLPNGMHNFFAYTYDSVSSRSSPGVSFSITVAGTDRPAISTPSQFVQTPTPLIEGTALPNTPVSVSFNGALDGTTRSNGSGGWSYIPTAKAPGVFSVIARAADSTGSLVDSNSISIVYQANVAPQITTPSFSTDDTTPTIQGTALPNVQVMISLSLPFHEGSAFSDASGNWSYTFSELAIGTLFDGSPGSSYGVVAQMLLAGNQLSAPSNSITITILGQDTSPPAIGSVTPVQDAFTNDPTPTIIATITDDSSGLTSVVILIDGAEVYRQTTFSDPRWVSVTHTASSLSEGSHALEIRATDAVGRSSGYSGLFTVDITAPTVEVSLDPTETTRDRKLISVTYYDGASGINGATRRIFVDLVDRTSSSLFTDDAWSWSKIFQGGSHSILAEARDRAGNLGQATLAFEIQTAVVTDTRAPEVEITLPSTSIARAGNFAMPVIVRAKDNADLADTGVTTVELLVDGVVVQTQPAAQARDSFYYVFTLMLPNASPAPLRLCARATDGGGNVSLTPSTPAREVSIVGPATTGPSSFLVQAPATVTAGTQFVARITPLDASGTTMSWSGIIQVDSNLASSLTFAFIGGGQAFVDVPFTIRERGVGVVRTSVLNQPQFVGQAVLQVNAGAPQSIDVEYVGNSTPEPGRSMEGLRAVVTDAEGNRVPNVTVNWQITFFQDSTSLGTTLLTITTNADGVALVPAMPTPENATRMDASASVSTGSGTATDTISRNVQPRALFNISFDHQTIEAGVPISFTITAIDPETGAVLEDFKGTVYIYRRANQIHGVSTFVGNGNQGSAPQPTPGEILTVNFTPSDKGVKHIYDGIVLTIRGETMLVASTVAPVVTSEFTDTVFDADGQSFATIQIRNIQNVENGLSGISNEIVVLPARPARFVTLSINPFLPVMATAILVDRFDNPVFLEPVEFTFVVNGGASTTFLCPTDVAGIATGFGSTSASGAQNNTVVATVKAPIYPPPDGVPAVTKTLTIFKHMTGSIVLAPTTSPVPRITLNEAAQAISDCSVAITGESTQSSFTLDFSLELVGESDALTTESKIRLSGGTITSPTPNVTVNYVMSNHQITGTLQVVNANPPGYSITLLATGLVVDVPEDEGAIRRHPDGRLKMAATVSGSGSDASTVAYFDKIVAFVGSVLPAGSPGLEDSGTGTRPAGVFIIDTENLTRTLIINPALIPNNVSSRTAGTFRVQVMDPVLQPETDLKIKLESRDPQGNPILDSVTGEPITAADLVVPLLVSSSTGDTLSSVLYSLPIVAVNRSFSRDCSTTAGTGRVTLRAQGVVPADGTTEAIVEILVRYEDGTPAPNATVQLTPVAPLLSPMPVVSSPVPTDAQGRTRATVKSSSPGTLHVAAEVSAEELDAEHPAFAENTNATPVRIQFLNDLRTIVAVPGGRMKATLVRQAQIDTTPSPVSGFDPVDAVALSIDVEVKPEEESAFRSASGALVKGTLPQVKFTFHPSYEVFENVEARIIVDDGSNTTALDRPDTASARILKPGEAGITAQDDTLTWAPSPGDPPFRIGSNRMTLVAFQENGPIISTSRMLNYVVDDPETPLSEDMVNRTTRPLEFESNPDVGEAAREEVILLFNDGLDDQVISDCLAKFQLAPFVLFRRYGFVGAHSTVMRSAEQMSAVAQSLRQEASVKAALPNLAQEFSIAQATAEDLPELLRLSYDAAVGSFGASAISGLRNNVQHFFTETFAAHRLLQRLGTPGPAARAGLVIGDAGFGDGKNGAYGEKLSVDFSGPGSAKILQGFSYSGKNRPNGLKANLTGDPINDLRDEDLPDGHGTAVLHLAAGKGTRFLGTGKDAEVILHKVGVLGQPHKVDGAASFHSMADAATNGSADVYNGSFGTGFLRLLDAAGKVIPGEMAEHSVASQTAINEFNLALRKPFAAQGKILVKAAGNDGANTLKPQNRAPTNDDRGGDASVGSFPAGPRVVGGHATGVIVGATEITDPLTPAAAEKPLPEATKGSNTWVVAPGGGIQVFALQANTTGKTSDKFYGTSFAAPQVSGLFAEMFIAGRRLSNAGGALTFNPAVKELFAIQLIEIVGVTADPVQNKPFFPGERDPNVGYGRMNAWKAMLVLANDGVSDGFTPQQTAAFPNLSGTRKLDNLTKYYGFKIKTNVHKCQVFLDNDSVQDLDPLTSPNADLVPATNSYQVGPGANANVIQAYRRVAPGGTVPAPGALANPEYVMVFSISNTGPNSLANRTLMRFKDPATGVFFAQIQLSGPNGILSRRNALTGTAELMPPNLPTDTNISGNIKFRSFVFEFKAIKP